MVDVTRALPETFADLAPFADKWVKETERERHGERLASSPEELRAFYDAMLPRMEAICDYLDQFPVDALPEPERCLMALGLSFMEVCMAVEMFNDSPRVPFGFATDRFEVHF